MRRSYTDGKVLIFHDPDKPNGYLSNWYPSTFSDAYNTYSCMEQYLMYHKARFFRDESMMRAIMSTRDPSIMKEFGRNVAGYSESVWSRFREGVLYAGLVLKFEQNPKLAKKLMKTGNLILAEGTDTDFIYANGLSRKDPNMYNPAMWPGKNMLGKCLMILRASMLKKERMKK